MRRFCFPLFLLFIAVLAFAARFATVRDVFIEGHIYFADADCYSRMTRVRMVDRHPGTIVRFHEFENYPRGVTPHTTAPMDYLIAIVKWAFDAVYYVFRGSSVLRAQTLDLAGALISPLLGVLACLWVAVWAKIMEHGAGRSPILSGCGPRPWPRFSWAAAPVFFAISPILVHGTSLGRPDHQSLLLLVLAVALGAECRVARSSSRGWMLASGISWGVALWVSLYEPVILLIAVILAWLVCAPGRLLARERLPGLIAFATVCAIAWGIEGWRIHAPESDMFIYLRNWNRTIGELKHLDLRRPLLYQWLGWGCVVSPILLAFATRHYRRAFPLLALLLVGFALTCWQLRWGYFLALMFAMTLPWQLAVLRRPWLAWTFFLVSLWPMFKDWDRRLFPDERIQAQLAQARIECVLRRAVAEEMRAPDTRPFLAPWWISPSIAYWSEQPGIAGSSHESLRGIIDSARFYLAPSANDAIPILQAREVKWVVATEPANINKNSAALLDMPAPKSPLATLLVQQPHSVAPFLQPVFANDFFKLFAVDDDQFPP